VRRPRRWPTTLAVLFSFCLLAFAARAQNAPSQIGREVAVPRHLQDGDEFKLSISQLNSGPFMHHGKFTTMRKAVLAHSGEALAPRQTFEALSPYERDCIIEFLKTLQVLSPQSRGLVVDENGSSKVQSQGPN